MRSSPAPLALLLVLVGAGAGAQERRASSPYPQRATRPDAEPQAVALVDDALGWLARHQEADGHWSAAGWRGRCAQAQACAGASDQAFDDGLAGFDAGVTALGALAFLGHGHTPHGGSAHAAAVDSALSWLVARQAADGSIGLGAPADAFGGAALEHGFVSLVYHPGSPPTGTFGGEPPPPGWALYNHAVATLALCEAVALGGDRFQAPAQLALNFALATQNPGLGWKYGPRSGRNDTSMTSWMAQGLRAGRDAGLVVPPESVEGACNWFVRVTDSEGNVGHETPGGGSSAFRVGGGVGVGEEASVTAAGWFVRVLVGGKVRSKELSDVGKRIIAMRPATSGPTSFTHHYYGASFLALRPRTRDTRAWRDEQVAALVTAARRDGCARGSFEPTEVWCVAGGRVYATALAAMALEAPWRLGGLKR